MSLAKNAFYFLSKILAKKGFYIVQSLSFKKDISKLNPNTDYIRYRCLELCHEEIVKKGIQGNIAELGVYKGNFASKLNTLFPDRDLYLFDTFEGFHMEDVSTERVKNLSLGDQDFSDTSIGLVLEKMPHPEKCIIKKGYFPDTAIGVDDRFCFVNIDTDLYAPILNGLAFFYPRLEKGGFLFVHDFNNDHYPGAREAVMDFCRENNIAYTPIPDSGGTVIIAK